MRGTRDNQLRVEEEERSRLISGLRYRVRLSVDADPEASTFRSSCAIDFVCSNAGASTFLNLRAPRVCSVVLNGRPLGDDEHGFDGVRLRLPDLREGDNRVEVLADCAYERSGVGLHRFVDPADGRLYLYTHLEPFDAHRVLACFDQPSLKGTLSMEVETPAAWTVCANAPLQTATTNGGRTLWTFATTPPLPPYLFAIASGEYEVLEAEPYGEVPLRLLCRRSLTADLRPQVAEIIDITRRGLAHLESRYGHAYPFGAYAQVFVPEANMGAMENPGCVTFNEAFIFRGAATKLQRMRRANVILHEMVHVMGFGDVVTMRDWGDLWLNETFATVEATLALDALGMPETWVDFSGTVKSRALMQDQLSTTHPILVDGPDTDSIRANFDGITYSKGASVLRQLIAWVGDEAYAAGIRSYFREFRWANATREDFLAHQSRESGRELGSWSRLWLETAGVNTVVAVPGEEDGRYTQLVVRQAPDAASGVLRPHHLKVAVYDEVDGSTRRRTSQSVELEGAEATAAAITGERRGDLLVANDEDLTYAKLRFDPRSLSYLVDGGLARIDDAHTRSLCLTALHDMARDAELPATRFVAAVAAHAPLEPDEVLLERALALASAVADRYAADSRRPAAMALLADTAMEQLRSERPPLVWMRCLAAVAREDRHLNLIAGLLEGSVHIAGLPMDPDLRWLLLARLATEGRATAADIEAALETDATDAGQRRALACLAARPGIEAKEEAWSATVEGSALSRARVSAALGGVVSGLFTAGGFHGGGRDQAAVVEPFVARYVDAIPRVWAERDYELARVLTEGLFPQEPPDAATVAAVEGLVADQALPWNCRRLLMEGRDGLVRARAARDADSALA